MKNPENMTLEELIEAKARIDHMIWRVTHPLFPVFPSEKTVEPKREQYDWQNDIPEVKE